MNYHAAAVCIRSLLAGGFLAAAKRGEVDSKYVARSIGTTIFDAPVIYSGLVSEALLDDTGHRPGTNHCCVEHFNSRQKSGYEIIEMWDRAGVMERNNFVEILEKQLRTKFCKVHLVTSGENTILEYYQNKNEATKDAGWEVQYEAAGIKLVKDPGTKHRPNYKYSVFEAGTWNVFEELKDAAKFIGVDYEEAYKRFTSPAKKWANFIRTPIGINNGEPYAFQLKS